MIRSLFSTRRFRSVFVPWCLAGLVVFAVQGSLAELSGPTASDRSITLSVVNLMRSEHLSRHPLDDEISERTIKAFVKLLDPMKVYFYQSDVDGFMKFEDELDEKLKSGDTAFSYEVFNTLVKRIDERVQVIDELLGMEHDFTVDEEMVIDPDVAKYPKDAAEARELWRKRIKYDLLVLKAAAEKDDSKNAKGKGKKGADAEKKPDGQKPDGQSPDAKAPDAKTPDAKSSDGPKKSEAKDGAGTDNPDSANPNSATGSVPGKPSADDENPKSRLHRRYHSFAKRMHQTDHQELLEMYLTAMTTAYDPHSTYMSPKNLENFKIMMRLDLEGIGAQLQFDDGYTVVKDLIPGGAADKEGHLKPEDRIVGVGQGEDGMIVDTMDMKLSDVVDMIRGKRGTTVRLEVIPSGKHERVTYNIVRDKIALTDSEARGRVIEKERGGQRYLIGVIDLPSFYMDMEGAGRGLPEFKSTERDVARILRDFRSKSVDAVVLDLRRNGGGSLTEAISVTGLFIDQGPIVQVKDKDGNVQAYDDPESGTEWDGPLVVLTSKFSASASEIFAGAIQDYQRGIIVGDKTTHGKGTVQSLLDLGKQLFRVTLNSPKLGALKITMQQFYRPDGDSTQNRGVVSDVVLPSMTNVIKGIGESELDYALAFDKVQNARHEDLTMVDAKLVEQVNAASTKRRENDDGFKRVLRNIERYQQQKSRKTITLNEAKFLAERAEVNAEQEEEDQFDDLGHSRRTVFDTKDYYNQEVLEITLDYLRLAKRVARAN